MVQITVLDTIAPVFLECPESFTTMNCIEVTYDLPQATDNCEIETMEQTEGLPSGATFTEGTTQVTYQATDPSGNTAQCSFHITVDNTLEATAEVSAYSCDPQSPYTATITATGGTEGLHL